MIRRLFALKRLAGSAMLMPVLHDVIAMIGTRLTPDQAEAMLLVDRQFRSA